MSFCRSSLLLLLCGCPRLGGDDDAGGETDTDGVEELEAPIFVDPLSELRMPVTRVDDLVFPVGDITLGVTTVVLDGENFGPLSDANRVGSLTSDALTLRLTGAMVPGRHTLRLQTRIGAEPLESREIAIEVGAQTTPSPVATIGDDVVVQADAVFATGYDDAGLLVALDLGAEPPRALVHRGAGTGWSLADRVEVALGDLDGDEEVRHAVHAHFVGSDIDGSGERVRVAWRTGVEGRAIVVADSPWIDPRPMPRKILDIAAIADSTEYARLGRPLLIGDYLVVEALLATDVEMPHPGDRTLVAVQISGAPLQAGEPRIVRVVGQEDIEDLGPTIDLLGDRGGPLTFAARVAGARPTLFTIDRDTGEFGTFVSAANETLSLLEDLALPMVTVLGAFDSRQVFAALRGGDAGARLVLRYFDDGESNGATDASPSAEQLAGIGDPTADPVATLIGGAPIYLVPMGVDAPAYAFVSTGPVPLVTAVDGMQCDEIAVPVTTESNRGDATQVACRRGRDVVLGTLRMQP